MLPEATKTADEAHSLILVDMFIGKSIQIQKQKESDFMQYVILMYGKNSVQNVKKGVSNIQI